ncbi:hypothetical protein Cni_G27688 [Canna indica]|uniref:FAD-binding domain-containing protein n=1 Tax=Canna indica TaxID=4628 RepID=A0AAQ3QN66_9LILI|nr:hypothetical protein Cni_G27688 [Canna indica]
MEACEDIVIVGAGIAGLAAALGLHRLGLRSLVLESSDTLRASGFAITTWTNAWRALDALGVGDSLRSQHLRLEKLIATSTTSGSVTAQLRLTKQSKHNGAEHEARCLKRNLLVETLAKELPPGTIRFSSKVVSIEQVGKSNLLRLADGSTIKTKVLIGSDGINSVVAKWLGLEVPIFARRYAARGITTFPDGHGLKPEFAQFFGKGYRGGMEPCDEQSVYWFLTWTSDHAEDKEMCKDAAKVSQLVLSKLKTAKASEEILHVIKKSELSSVACSPLRYRSPLSLLRGEMSRGGVCVIGDAFHPMTPDLAEGGCSALEDGVVLAKCLGEGLICGGGGKGEDQERRIEKALGKYAEARRWRSFELVARSYLVGVLQEGGSWAMNALRDRVLSGLMANMLLSEADFDCGKLDVQSL